MSDLTLTVRKTIAAAAEDVFNAWLDPDMIKRFMIPMEGASISEATVDAREGGEFAFTFMAGDEAIPHKGTYKEITRHSRLVFSWISPFSADGSTVTLTFTPKGEAETDVELFHEKFLNEDSVASHTSGWTSILDTLANTVSS